MTEDTIAAPATPAGSGAIAVIRISGNRAKEIIDRIFDNNEKLSHALMVHGNIISAGRRVDEVMAVYFAAPASYTGEDSVEIYCHASAYGTYDILKCITDYGARIAQPGEFTRRAFLNGKMDLTQAEAVCDFISASSDAGARAAQSQLQGKLKRTISGFQDLLSDILAEIEAAVEYPEEDLEFSILQKAVPYLEELLAGIRKLADSYDTGRILKEGLWVVIAGKPNVGKSSVLNALSGQERAIVTARPGTTRDTVEQTISVHGIAINLMDTAGIRTASDEVEALGIRRSVDAVKCAQLTLFIVDSSAAIDDADREAFRHVSADVVIILNKTDAGQVVSEDDIRKNFGDHSVIPLSALTGNNIEILRQELYDFAARDKTAAEGVLVTNIRHRDLLLSAASHIEDGLQALRSGVDMDCVTIDLNCAWADMGGITGNTVTEEIINRIFDKFCLGK